MQKSGYFLHGTMRKYNGTFIALPYKIKSSDVVDEDEDVNNNKGTLKMYIMMFPNERKLKKFEMNIDKVNFNKINTSYSSMDLALPKFKIESKLDLSSVFSKMGINEMFGYSVYLKDIVNTTSAKIGEVIQKVVIEVDEEGTKVAAITGGFGEVKVESLHVQTIIKPFVITIVSEYYGTVLFSARICDPTIDIFQYHLNNLKKT
ncbi:serpin A12-like [Aphidius gifuensis]|uniref:serpin A12-like n=1 Tax=Aphidius gifuensis TaxID=684658 RepID=UPI001CDCBC37|nr:serpin A12-like [Aphidius gifuensis]